MAPIKFEEHIKEKLDKRIIQPSDDAWDKLSKRLDEEGKENKNKPYKWWLSIAASIIIGGFIVSMFFNNKIEQEIVVPEIVVDQKVEKEDVNSVVVADSENVREELIKVDTEEVIKKPIKKPLKTSVVENVESLVTDKTDIQEENVDSKFIKPLPKNLTFEEQKVQEVVAQVKDLKEHNKDVTEEDIEKLLAQAQKEIALERLYNENSRIVDASKLLEDVEFELDQSFRNKVLEAMKTSFNSVKTAVAQRND